MLKLKQITKQYRVGEKVVDALNGITVDFLQKELVAVLGASGCGKTTLMNIIGGLDRATSGDLIIDGITTKDYKDSDWNNYRNHQIGFVFQAYNLIPHMTVFSNVELALTLSGVSAKERKARVLEALAKVGLSDQVNKKPNQMSGGQMQRVAIARALVNNPKILLADEPTGAVDSKTGIQIMELLKEISKDCLVILVTHNQELANNYSDRIISMQDGLIVSDNQIERSTETIVNKVEQTNQTTEFKQKKKKAKMSFMTSIKLSFNNLWSKKGRSFITVISGAISVICIALILAMNSGFAYYIDNFERNNLSRFPIKVTTQTTSVVDLLIEAFTQGKKFDAANVNLNSMLELFKEDQELREKYTDTELIYLSKLVLAVIEKGITGFQNLEDFEFENEFDVLSELFGISLGTDIVEFMNALENDFNKDWGAIMHNYNINFNIYRKDAKGDEARLNPVDMFIAFLEDSGLLAILNLYPGNMGSNINALLYGEDMQKMREMFDNNNPWSMMIDSETLLNAQYDVLAGRLPAFGTDAAKNEIVLVVDEFNQLDDFTLFLLGAITVESFMLTVVNEFRVLLPPETNTMLDLFIKILFPKDTQEVKTEYDFNEFIGGEDKMPATFVLRIPTDYYALDEAKGVYNKTGEGVEVEVVGILRLKNDVNAGVISGAIGYTEALAKALIEKGNNAPVIEAMNDALAEFDALRETLLTIAQRILALDYDITSLPQISLPQRITTLSKIFALAQNVNITEEQITLISEIAGLLDGFEFTPENQEVVNQIITLYSSLEISEENYAMLAEALALLEGLDSTEGNIDALIRIANLLENLDSNEENIAAFVEAVNLLSNYNISEEDIDILRNAANLLSQFNPSEDNIAVLMQAANMLSQLDPNSENIATITQMAKLLKGLSLTEKDKDTIVEIIDILSGLNFEADSAVLEQILELAGRLTENPDSVTLWAQMAGLIGELTNENAQIITRALPLLFELGLTASDIAIILDAAKLAIQLDLSSQNIKIIINVASTLSDIELSEDNIQILIQIGETLSQLEISEENAEILKQILEVLSTLELSDNDAQILKQVVDIVPQLELSYNDAEIFMQIAGMLQQLEITEDDIDTLMQIANLLKEINMDSEDMIALQEALGLAVKLVSSESEIDNDVLREIVSLVSELELTSEDIKAVQDAMALVEQIQLDEDEQAALQDILAFVQNIESLEVESLGDFIRVLQKIQLTQEEEAAAWEALELVMTALGFNASEITNILGLARSIIELNLTAEEVDFIIEMLPTLSQLDFSKGEKEIMNQLGSVFKIRNVVVQENKACTHSPNAAHTKDCAWFDTAQYNALLNIFDLRDLMRTESVDIYPYSIESRNQVLNFINNYNLRVLNDEKLSKSTIDYTVVYTDELSEMTASMSSMINTITYILIAVAAIAVVVAMLLVAIILYISVQDRTKEIGLLRSLGASKLDVSGVFIAETFIIGLVSGIVGVGLALLLTFPANIIIKSVLGINDLLKPIWWHQFALIGVAFIITVISGLIPAALAAKKDPVLAIRSE